MAISRGLTWLAVLVTLVLVYVAVVSAVTLAVSGAGDSLWPGVLAAVVTVALSPSVHAAYRREVNLCVHGAEDDPASDLAVLGRRLEGRPLGGQSAEMLLGGPSPRCPPDSAPGGVAAADRRRPRRRRAGRRRGARRSPRARRPGGGSLELPAALAELGRHRRRQVARLLPGLAVVAHGALPERMLSRATGELAGVREGERRELHRELHDGLGPALPPSWTASSPSSPAR